MRRLLALFPLVLFALFPPNDAKALSLYDNYDAWAIAVNAPISAACMSSPDCFANAPFSAPNLASRFSESAEVLGKVIGPSYVLDDGDIAVFNPSPNVRAVAFSGAGRTLGSSANPSFVDQAIFGLNIRGLTIMSSTGFIGLIDDQPFTLGSFAGASRTIAYITGMYFDSASAPGFESTLHVPEPSTFALLALGLCLIVGARRFIGSHAS